MARRNSSKTRHTDGDESSPRRYPDSSTRDQPLLTWGGTHRPAPTRVYAMIAAIADKPTSVREAIHDADHLLVIFQDSGLESLLEEHAPVAMATFNHLFGEDDADVVQFAYCLLLNAILAVPVATAGMILHTFARSLLERISEGMPAIERVA